MTIENQDILTDFYSGNTKDLRITVVQSNGSAKDLTNSSIVFALFREGKTDTVVLMKSTMDGTIEISNAAGGILTVLFNGRDTKNVYGTFRYQVNVTDANGVTETVTTGKINIIRGHASRYRKATLPCYTYGQ